MQCDRPSVTDTDAPRIDATWTYWTSVYFVGHLSLPLLYSLALALGPLLDRLLGPGHGATD